MILTNTRFRRRPSRLTGQPFRLASKDPLPGAKVEAAIRHRHHHLAAHHAQHFELRSASGVRRQPVPSSWTGVLAGAVVLVLTDGHVGGETFQPLFIVGV
jgi:hypothetical protein